MLVTKRYIINARLLRKGINTNLATKYLIALQIFDVFNVNGESALQLCFKLYFYSKGTLILFIGK